MRAPCYTLLPLVLLSGPALAAPMDLHNPQPRWVYVASEISPRERPAQLDTVYTEKLPAWFEPGDVRGQVKVTLDGRLVERYLVSAQNPKPGSFSDFVWVFDVATGHVLSAAVSGTLIKRIHWGLFSSEVEADIEIRMATQRVGGFRRPKRILGHLFFSYCTDADEAGCTTIEPSGYDPASGYVNAVGEVLARYHHLRLRTFSPLGEALFTEMPSASEAAVVAR